MNWGCSDISTWTSGNTVNCNWVRTAIGYWLYRPSEALDVWIPAKDTRQQLVHLQPFQRLWFYIFKTILSVCNNTHTHIFAMHFSSNSSCCHIKNIYSIYSSKLRSHRSPPTLKTAKKRTHNKKVCILKYSKIKIRPTVRRNYNREKWEHKSINFLV